MSSRTTCIVYRCHIKGGYNFPTDVDTRQKWLKAIRWAIPLDPKKTAVVCPAHFIAQDFEPQIVDGESTKELRPDAVPSIFPWNSDLWVGDSSTDLSSDDDLPSEASEKLDGADTGDDGVDVQFCALSEDENPPGTVQGEIARTEITPCDGETQIGTDSSQGIGDDFRQDVTRDQVIIVGSSSESQSPTRDVSALDDPASSAFEDVPSNNASGLIVEDAEGKRGRPMKTILPERRTIYNRLTKDQRAGLELIFATKQFPSQHEKEEICRILALSFKTVHNWFARRRCMLKNNGNTGESRENRGTLGSPDKCTATQSRPSDSSASSRADTDVQQRLQKLWMYYGVQGCEVPHGRELEKVAANCRMTTEGARKWFEYAKRRFSGSRYRKNHSNALLLKTFILNCYPSEDEVERISYSTGMSSEEIHNWFRTERYWQTLYFNDDEVNLTQPTMSLEDESEVIKFSNEKSPSSKELNPSLKSFPQGDEYGSNTESGSMSISDEEEAPEIELARDTEAESPQPRPSSPLWSDSGSLGEVNLPDLVGTGQAGHAVLREWADKYMQKKKINLEAPVDQDEPAPKKKKEDADSSSDCEIIEPDLPTIELDSDDDEPVQPAAATTETKSTTRYPPDAPRAVSQKPGTKQLDVVLKNAGPLKPGSTVRTASNEVYQVLAVKTSTNSSSSKVVWSKRANANRAKPAVVLTRRASQPTLVPLAPKPTGSTGCVVNPSLKVHHVTSLSLVAQSGTREVVQASVAKPQARQGVTNPAVKPSGTLSSLKPIILRSRSNFVGAQNAPDNKPTTILKGVIQSGHKDVSMQPNVAGLQASKRVRLAPVGQTPLREQKEASNFVLLPNLTPEENQIPNNQISVVKLSLGSGYDGHCKYVECELLKTGIWHVTDKNALLERYKTDFIPKLSGLIYWGHSREVKRIFSLQKIIVGKIMGLEATPEHFSYLKILTLPSMYILQCLIHAHKNLPEIRKNVKLLSKLPKSSIAFPHHAVNGLALIKVLPPEMNEMRTDVFVTSLKVFLQKYPLFNISGYFDIVKNLGSNANNNNNPTTTASSPPSTGIVTNYDWK